MAETEVLGSGTLSKKQGCVRLLRYRDQKYQIMSGSGDIPAR